jgi:multidrug efflux system membrane fusion protein
MSVRFQEGQLVNSGDLLAEIDARPYQAQLLQAQGQLARDQALLRQARVDLDRYKVLWNQDSIAKQILDQQAALVGQYEGAVKLDQGQIDAATVNVVYCHITAPIAGRVGLRLVDPGNIVHTTDTNGLLVITQLQPITVIFTIAEDNLPPVYRKLNAGERLGVDAYDRAGQKKIATGSLLTVDNQIDPTTGTVRLKALFPNDDNALFPNQFVNVRLQVETQRAVIIVPDAAIQRASQRTFVYVVKPDQTVTVRQVTVGATESGEASIETGLSPGDIVVVNGVDKLQEGSKVDVQMSGNDARKGNG